ncbi:TPA: hypothetical protein OVC47_001554 [Staphylococcus aureus]|nr:hypothetical protein [Staphylococcus aureus]
MNYKDLILNTILKDDDTSTGGKSHDKETLIEFMNEVGINHDAMLGTINYTLKQCGILPINEFNYPELFKYTLNDLKYYIAINYDYMDCFNYKKFDKEHHSTFIEEIIVQNVEKNSINFPYEFGELIIKNDSISINKQLSM